MNLVRLSLLVLLTAAPSLPVVAQTAQTTPGKPATPSIPTTAGKPAAEPTVGPAARPSSPALIDINSATSSDLDALPGIGKTRAEAIIKNRPYNGKDDLVNRGIIPDNVYKDIANKIIARKK